MCQLLVNASAYLRPGVSDIQILINHKVAVLHFNYKAEVGNKFIIYNITNKAALSRSVYARYRPFLSWFLTPFQRKNVQ